MPGHGEVATSGQPHRIASADPTIAGGSDRLAVDIRGLCKAFQGRVILDGATLALPQGRLGVLAGRNGVGKTTLLRILATLVVPDGGSAKVLGVDVRRSALGVRKLIGLSLVNERSLYWRLSALENLKVFARVGGLSRREATRRGVELLEELGISDVAGRRVGDISAGQKQRLVLARAALRRPPLLLLDEPMRGLDDEGVALVLGFLDAHTAAGGSVLVVAPAVHEFEERDDAKYVLDQGVIHAVQLD